VIAANVVTLGLASVLLGLKVRFSGEKQNPGPLAGSAARLGIERD
jgi:hypothetical protein